MKLPRKTTRRYQILKAFVGQTMTLDELISAFGMFGMLYRSALQSEINHLVELDYMRGDSTGYSLSRWAAAALREGGEDSVELVPPRQYNVYLQPPLSAKYLISSAPRRPGCPETRPERRLTASSPIDFQVDE